MVLDAFIAENKSDNKCFIINHSYGLEVAYVEDGEYKFLNSKEVKEFFTNHKVKVKSDLKKVFTSVKFEIETGLESSYSKARRMYPNLTEIEDGNQYCFWRSGDWMKFNITDLAHSGGSECKIVKIEDLMKEDFVPEVLYPIIKKNDAYVSSKKEGHKELKN